MILFRQRSGRFSVAGRGTGGCNIHRGLTDNFQVTLSASHRVCVHLTHVPPAILLLNLLYVKVPRTMVIVRQRYPWILRDDITVDGQDSLRIDTHPCHLEQISPLTCLVRENLILRYHKIKAFALDYFLNVHFLV